MKKLSLIAFFICLFIMGYITAINAQGKQIIKQSTDDRGLISVVYSENGKQWAFDYLTKSEYDSIFKQIAPRKIAVKGSIVGNHVDKKGNSYPIYLGSKGGRYIIRTAGTTGKTYRQYLNL